MHKRENTTSFLDSLKALDILILMFFVYSVQFVFFPLNTNRIVLVAMLFSLLVLQRGKVSLIYDKSFLKAHAIMFLYLVYAIIVTLIDSMRNMNSMLNVMLIFMQLSLGSYLISKYFIQRSIDYLLFCLLIIFGIQGALVFLNFIIPSYRELLFVLMPPGGNITEDHFSSAFRTRGFTQNSGAIVSAYFGIGFLIAAYFLSSLRLSRKDRNAVLITLPLVLISLLFTGRTGLIIIPLAFVLYYFLLFVNERFQFKSLGILITIPLASVLVYFVIRIGISAISPDYEIIMLLWEKWALDNFLVNFGLANETTSGVNTLHRLEAYIIFPSDNIKFFFGDTTTWGVIRTDLGYIRMLFSVGFLGALLFYSAFIYIFLTTYNNVKTYSLKVLISFFMVWMLIVEYKEPVFGNIYFASTIFLLYFFSTNKTDVYESL